MKDSPMLPRPLFTPEHTLFRESVRRFIAQEIVPHHPKWEKQGIVPRDIWTKAGDQGLLCCTVPEKYSGPSGDFLHSAIVIEELAKAGASGPGFSLQTDIVTPYILHYGSEEQKKTWLPRMVSGDIITAIAMTEPGTGSDLQSVKTSALMSGNELEISGQKTFITNGHNADLVIVVAKTEPDQGASGISLVLVETDREGFSRGRNLEKTGLKAQDTSELFFDNVRVPRTNLLGEEGGGFKQLMQELPQERLVIAIGAVASCEAALEWTVTYTQERKAFGKSVSDFQNTRFKLAEIKTDVTAARAFLDRCLELHMKGSLDATTGAMIKLWTTELQGRVLDECVQLHGGYGYMWEYPIARAWADARIQRIYGGTSEIMKELISRTL